MCPETIATVEASTVEEPLASASSNSALPCSACLHKNECPRPADLANTDEKTDKKRIADKLAFIGIAGNIVLSGLKLLAGLLGNSAAMVSDAVHSLSDVAATAIAYLGVRIASKNADTNHQYGHERFECLAAMVLGVILACTGIGIGWSGIQTIIGFFEGTVEISEPTILPAIAAVVSILAKEGMARYTLHWANIAKSDAFRADAKHHRSDALSSVGALIGIGASMLGFPLGDPIASVVISALILYMAYEVVFEAVEKMTDMACDTEMIEDLVRCICASEGVERLDILRSRKFGARVFIDAEIAVDSSLTIVEAHDIAERTHDRIEQCFPDVKHIMIHVNPA